MVRSLDAVAELHENISSDDRSWFRRLLSRVNSGSPNYPTFAGQALLHASRMGDTHLMDTLLRSVRNTVVIQNALQVAATGGKGAAIRMLLDRAWSRCKDAIPAAVYSAAQSRRSAEVQMLMETNFRFKKPFFDALINLVVQVDDAKTMRFVLAYMDRNQLLGWASLPHAAKLCAQMKRQAVFETILPYLQPDVREVVLNTAFKFATFGADRSFAECLLKAGTDPFAMDHDAFIAAGAGGSVDMVEWLLELGADPLARKGEILVQAAFFDRASVVTYLLWYGREPQHKVNWAWWFERAMTAAIHGESLRSVEILAEQPVHLSPALLQVAADQGNIQVFRVLDDRLSSPPSILQAAMMRAAKKNHPTIVSYLLKRGIAFPES